jgi:hypothetical protein
MIRAEHGISVTRFCELVGLPRRETGGRLVRGPWPTPVLDRIDPLVAEVAASFAFFGYRKVWGRLRLDGQDGISASSVRRSMRRQGLLQRRRYQAERRALAQARKAVFVTPPSRRNRLWQLDWTEFETLAGGGWNYAPTVDYWAKVALAASASPTKTTADAVLTVEAAIAEVERLLGRTLREECVHPSTPATSASTSASAIRPSASRVGLKIVISRPTAWSLPSELRSSGGRFGRNPGAGCPTVRRVATDPRPGDMSSLSTCRAATKPRTGGPSRFVPPAGTRGNHLEAHGCASHTLLSGRLTSMTGAVLHVTNSRAP